MNRRGFIKRMGFFAGGAAVAPFLPKFLPARNVKFRPGMRRVGISTPNVRGKTAMSLTEILNADPGRKAVEEYLNKRLLLNRNHWRTK